MLSDAERKDAYVIENATRAEAYRTGAAELSVRK